MTRIRTNKIKRLHYASLIFWGFIIMAQTIMIHGEPVPTVNVTKNVKSNAYDVCLSLSINKLSSKYL